MHKLTPTYIHTHICMDVYVGCICFVFQTFPIIDIYTFIHFRTEKFQTRNSRMLSKRPV